MRRLQVCLSAACLIVAVAGVVEAQTRKYEVGEVIVTGSKSPQTPGNVTQKVEIITVEDLEGLVVGNGNLAEMLSYSAGNFANVLSRNDANWGSAGGLAHTYKGYMLDGLPIDAFVDLQSLDVWAFDRVEDQRGSASVLYPTYLAMDFAGNQSPLAGTANFILRERVDETMTRAGARYGTYNTLGGRFYHQRAADNLHLFFGADYEDSDYTDYGTQNSWLNMLKDPEYEKTKLYARGTYYLPGPEGHRVGLYVHRTWHSGDAGRINRDFGHRYTTVNASYVRPIGESITGTVKAGWRGYDRLYEEDNFPDLSLREEAGVESSIIPVDASLAIEHGGNDLLTIGADYQLSTYETTSETDAVRIGNDAEATGWGIYAQEEQRFSDFVVRVGARLTGVSHDINLFQGGPPGDDSNSWTKLLWSGGVRYNASPTLSLFANAGSSFKAPGLKSVGGTISPGDTLNNASASGHLPNPDIDPESGIGLDIGGDMVVREGLSIGARGFYIALDDQIVQIEVPATGSLSQDINAGKTTTLGLEAEVTHYINETINWFGNYTYTTTDIENDTDPDKDGASMNFVPDHVVNAGVRLRLPQDIRAVVTLQYYSGINVNISNAAPGELDGYAIINARLEKSFVTRDGLDVALYLEPYNLANNDFELPWGFQDPGFSTMGGLTIGF